MIIRIIFFCVSIFSCSNALSQVKSASALPDMTATLFQVFGALIFIVLLIFASAWSAKKLKLTGSSGANSITMISSMALGRKEKISLIEVGGKKILIGVGAGNVSTLHVFEDTQTFSAAMNNAQTETNDEFSNSQEESVDTKGNDPAESDQHVSAFSQKAIVNMDNQAVSAKTDFSQFLSSILNNGGRNVEK